jgi:acyl dehydratase
MPRIGHSPQLFFDDLEVGATRDLGSFVLTEDEIVEFALRYDPQPFHVDAVLAESSFYGGIVASGLHTFVVFSRLLYDGLISDIAVVAGRGLREMRLKAPVRPDERIHGRAEILEKRPSSSRPSYGDVAVYSEAARDDGTVVLTVIGEMLVQRRSAAS